MVCPRRYHLLSLLSLSSSSTAKKRRIMIRIRAGRERGRMNDRRKSLIAGQVCGSNDVTANPRGTSGKRRRTKRRTEKRRRRKRRRKIKRKKPRAKIKTPDLQLLGMRRRRLRCSLRCRHSLTRRRQCRALARCGVVVAHVLASMSSGSLGLTVARRSAKRMRPQ